MSDKLRLKVKELELEEAKARIIRLEQLLKEMTASRDWEYEDGLRNLRIRIEQHDLILDLMKRLEAIPHNPQPDDTPDWLK